MKNKMFSEIKNEIKNMAIGSTAYGVPNLFRSKRLLNKVFWLFFLVASSAVSCVYVYLSIIDYYKFDVVTLIETVYEQPTEFPTVTFCSYNGLFNNYSLNQLISKNTSRFGYDFSIGMETDQHFSEFTSQELGRCFRFNSGLNMNNDTIPIKNSTIGGRDDFFWLEINAPFSCLENCRIVVWIHNKSAPPKIEQRNNHDSPIVVNCLCIIFL